VETRVSSPNSTSTGGGKGEGTEEQRRTRIVPIGRTEIDYNRRCSARNDRKHEQHGDAGPDQVQLIGERASASGDDFTLVHRWPTEIEDAVCDQQTRHDLASPVRSEPPSLAWSRTSHDETDAAHPGERGPLHLRKVGVLGVGHRAQGAERIGSCAGRAVGKARQGLHQRRMRPSANAAYL